MWLLLSITDSYSIYGVAKPGSAPFPVAIGTLGNQWLWVPAVGLLGIYVLLLFPDGKLPSRRWRPLAGALLVLESLAEGLAPGPLENQGGVPNPFGLEEFPWLGDATLVLLPLLPLCIVASAVSLVLRYRRSGGEQREQIKWIAFAASVAGLMYLIAIASPFIFAPEIVSGGSSPSPPLWVELLFSVAVLGFAGVPVAVGIAILRYRLYEIDILINRTLVYGSLTSTLVALYFGGIVMLQRPFVVLTGQKSTLAVVASTLVIAALFQLYLADRGRGLWMWPAASTPTHTFPMQLILKRRFSATLAQEQETSWRWSAQQVAYRV